ncbi:MAG TPA: tetratricopeptide repeat protein [Bryobacteraceae bacterium]|nr:tetratricopeptide repeat protein [Bryobacteraceae bacterium]
MKKRLAAHAAALILAAMPLLAQQAAAPAGPHPKSQKELEALQKVQAAQQSKDWDAELAAITNVLENFANTDFKIQLLNMAMGAAQQKNDLPQIVTWGERLMEADPNDISSRVTLAEATAQHTRDNDLDKAQSIQKINDYAHKAQQLLTAATKPPEGMPEAEWPTYKKQLTSQTYDALAQAAALDKKYPEAIANYKQAIEADPSTSAVSVARMAKAYFEAKQYDEAISTADKVLAMNEASPAVKTFAQQQKDNATKMKGGAK